ncbi:50S ribosomal protein L21 [Clostridiales bacterium PH28_bin88]|nr:50S ribosomal protein L21 [Clostridiales bacterium PH28_bin88]
MYAIIETGGKQYRVQEGDVLRVEKLPVAEGETLDVEKVLALGGDGEPKIGTPLVAGAKVTLKVLEHGKGDKIIVFKYKAKKNYRRKTGHRQPFSKVKVEKIQA